MANSLSYSPSSMGFSFDTFTLPQETRIEGDVHINGKLFLNGTRIKDEDMIEREEINAEGDMTMTSVENGYIVRVNTKVYVFSDMSSMLDFVEENCKTVDKAKEFIEENSELTDDQRRILRGMRDFKEENIYNEPQNPSINPYNNPQWSWITTSTSDDQIKYANTDDTVSTGPFSNKKEQKLNDYMNKIGNIISSASMKRKNERRTSTN